MLEDDNDPPPNGEPAWASEYRTRDDPGSFIVPALDRVCDGCKRLGITHKCLYPDAKAMSCVICRRRKTGCRVLGQKQRVVQAAAPSPPDLAAALGPSWAAFGNPDTMHLVQPPPYLSADPSLAVIPSTSQIAVFADRMAERVRELSETLEKLQAAVEEAAADIREVDPPTGLVYLETCNEFDAALRELERVPPEERRPVPLGALIEQCLVTSMTLLHSAAAFVDDIDMLCDACVKSTDLFIAVLNLVSEPHNE